MTRQGLIQHEQRPRYEETETDTDLLAVVVEILPTGNYFVRPRGRKGNAHLEGTLVWNALQIHELRFADVVVVSVEKREKGDKCIALRAPNDAEFESR
jgi:hypothetical protein